jgi:hypothetical protein
LKQSVPPRSSGWDCSFPLAWTVISVAPTGCNSEVNMNHERQKAAIAVLVVELGLHPLFKMAADSTTRYEHESRDLIRGAPTIEREVMNKELLETMSARVGARVRVHPNINGRNPAGIDIRTDKLGEYFDIAIDPRDSVDYEVIDMRPDRRQLLLMARRDRSKQKFLCGHDERHWFVCAVPGASVSNVVNAIESLQPVVVRTAVQRRVKRIKNRLRRKNEAFIRQGECSLFLLRR